MERPAQRMVAALPDDLLAEVLRRLAPRSLAACRCVCKPWRDLVDERRLLRADLLPHSLAGIFINFSGLFYPEFFARPSTTISGRLDFLPFGTKYYNVEDHCNGLLLLDLYDCYCVVNPATRWWARLPPRPPLLDEMETDHIHTVYLVFDPAASPNYEVFVIPCIQNWRIQVEQEPSECPPSVYVLSSRTERWEERTFVREGEAARTGIVPDMRFVWRTSRKTNAVYWQGALYLHCQSDFIMRISLRNDQYQVIKLPKVTRMPLDEYFYLGRSQKGVYLALALHCCHLLVWILNESCGEIKWELKHDKDIKHVLLGRNKRQGMGPWILQEINYQIEYDERYSSSYGRYQKKLEYELNKEATLEKTEWSSDDDNVPYNEDITGRYNEAIYIIGFHPFKEIIFFGESFKIGIAYHLNSSKVEDLGDLWPVDYGFVLLNERMIYESYPYTPCWM